uniref:Protein TsetseEP domain-containing protein n=1 Tax=Anopheles melas TaxID=34690 RepID=A0A182UCR5_9DIPT
MKLLLVVLFASVAWAQRPLTVAVIDKMYQVYPMYRQIQDYVINQVADARMASSARIDEFHRDIIMIKSNYLATSIRQEQDLITQINGQPLSVNQQCLSFLRQSAEVNMNLAGVSYSTCITNAGDSLVNTVKDFYELLDTDEARYVGVGLFEEFRDENVFFDPQRIISKLENRVFRLEDYPTHIGSEVLDAVAGLSNMLENIRLNYINCMTLGEQMLRSALQLGLLQLEQTCNGNLIPVAEEAPVPPNVGHREVTASPGLNQLTTDDAMYGDDRAGPSNPQKRGVNPLLYREAELRNDFSGNSIPQNGVWEDVDLPLPGMPYPLELFDAPIEPGPFDRFNQQQQQQRTYDVLQNLLSRQPSPYNPLFIGRPVSGGYPVRMHGSGGAYGTERKKRTLATGPAKSYSHQMR